MKSKLLLQVCGAAAVALLPLSSTFAQADDGDASPAPKHAKGGMSVDDRVAKMKDALGLSDDQVTKIKAIMGEQKTAMDPIKKDDSMSKEDKMAKVKEIMADSKTKINAVLTPEQQDKMKSMHKGGGGKKKKDATGADSDN